MEKNPVFHASWLRRQINVISLAMKLLTLLIFTGSMALSASTYSQKTKIDLKFENSTLTEILTSIEKTSEFIFIYNQNVVNSDLKRTIIVKDENIEKVLSLLFEGADISFRIDDRQVFLYKKDDQKSLEFINAGINSQQPQKKEISGSVKDSKGQPLPGVSVVVKGTTIGVITDNEGNFKISVPNDSRTIVFSFIGMKVQEISIEGKSMITVAMVEEAVGINEVVVVGYGEMRKKDMTGSVSSFNPDDRDGAKQSSVDKMLQGKIAGVNVRSTTATPGAAVSVIIRGANSLRGDNQPLYVIDNIPIASTTQDAASAFSGGDLQIAQNPLLSLNPEDIASVEILKDASATAIYGSRGANGVILITTKKGKAGKADISFTTSFSLSQPAKLHEMLGLTDYAKFMNSRQNTLAATQYFFEGDQVRYVLSGQGASYNSANPDTYFTLENHNWQNEIYRSAFSKNYGIKISGGSEKLKYYFSAGFKDIQGLVKQTGMKQGNFRLNLNANLTDRLSIDFIVNGSMRSNDMMQGADLLKGTASGSITRTAIDAAPHLIPAAAQTSEFETKTTIWSWLDDYDDLTSEKTFSGSTNLRYKISNTLSYNLRMGGNTRFMNRDRWFGLQLFKGANENGSLGISDLRASNYTVENLLNFNKNFTPYFRLNSFIGATYDDYNSLNKLYTGNNFNIYSLRTKGLHLANNVVVLTPAQKDYQLASYLGRANMVFLDGRYIATVNFRADGSSKFKQDKWGYFPSTAMAWSMQDENFIKQIQFINQLKLRAGWGITGNQSIEPYSTINDYGITTNTSATDLGGKALATSITRLANENLTWETTNAWNFGIDFSLFNQRLSGSVDLYQKTTKNLLVQKDIPSSTGFTSITVNQGSLANKGIEIVLSGVLIKKKDLVWDISGNIAFNKGQVLDFGLPEAQWGIHKLKAFVGNNLGSSYYVNPANIFAVGYEPAMFWGYKTAGIIQDIEEIAYIDASGNKQYTKYSVISGGASPKPGDVKFVDLNNDGVVNEKDRTFIGNPNPNYTFGFQTTLTYKNISLSASFNGVQGRDILNANRYSEFQPGQASSNIRKEVYQNMWTTENKSNLYPSVNSQRFNSISDLIVEDGSFLRCSDVTLSYDLPKGIAGKLRLTKINFYLTGQNLFLITKYKGYDPDVDSFAFDGMRQGIDWSGFPGAKAYTFGFKVTF